MSSIALHRPGAIGDIIMILNCAPKLREQFNKIDLYCHESIVKILKNFCLYSGIVDNVIDSSLLKRQEYDKVVDCIGYPIKEGYPNVRMKKHLIYYFAEEMGIDVTLDDVELNPLPPLKLNKRLYITIQNKTGWSIYKEWWGWQQLIDRLKDKRPDIGVYQIGGPNDPKLSNIDGSFTGGSFEDNLAVQTWGRAHLGLDSVFNHTSNYKWRGIGKKNCVILFGSTQYDASGYQHNTNISLGLSCQPCFRENPDVSSVSGGICPNPPNQTYQEPKHKCMFDISVDIVYDALLKKLYEN